ncbi:hypothetical protein BpHYR1_015085 [Brachionus plicatilis]|uniref:Uncharacterized protein n=1 Tax=Brachionus plicatilis TaxID=10195 RepID=A0A3M7QBY5_BRAPC|nr:hypothetical protein BpHYR1_015085 [Brachionus plicatilis]
MQVTLKIVILMAVFCPLVIKAIPRRPINSDFVNGQWARIGKRSQQMDINKNNEKAIEIFVSNSLENFCSKKAFNFQDQDDFETYFDIYMSCIKVNNKSFKNIIDSFGNDNVLNYHDFE